MEKVKASAIRLIQAQTEGAPTQETTDEEKRDDFLTYHLQPRVAGDFEGALALVDEFLTATSHMNKWPRITVIARAGAMLYFETPPEQRAKRADASIKVIADELQKVQTTADQDRAFQIWATRELVGSQLQILMAEKRVKEAAKVLDDNWTVVNSYPEDGWELYSYWREIRNRQGQPEQAVDGLIKVYQEQLPVADSFSQDAVSNIVAELLSQGKSDEALSWAKLEWMLCPFSDEKIQKATQDVTKSLSARDLSLVKANLFVQAQIDSSVTNPLDEVPLPTYDISALRVTLANPDDQMPPNARITSLLAVGNYRGAMLAARSQLAADVSDPNRALQVARVFKAKDGNIVRANQFMAFYQAGQGDNPVPAFLKETEAVKPAAPAAG